MMEERAFPGPCQVEQRVDIHEGMTLRDYFAAAALPWALALNSENIAAVLKATGIDPVSMTKEQQDEFRVIMCLAAADAAYAAADAMMERRKTAEAAKEER